MCGTLSTTWRSPGLETVPGLVHGFEVALAAERGAAREDGRRSMARHVEGFGRVFFMTQVHGARVVAAPWDQPPEADAATVGGAGLLVAVETADCLPVLLVDARLRIAAAVHAGWRGTAAGVLGRAVDALAGAGAEPARLLVAFGPCIGACCYEVGEELRSAFGSRADSFFFPAGDGRPHLDLRAANRAQLLEAGVGGEQIEDVGACTFCHPDRLPSFRREGKACGRIVSYVGWTRSAEA